MSAKKATNSAGTRSYYSDDYTDYSDSFVSEDDDLPPLKKLGNKTATIKKNTSSSTVSGKKSTISTVKGRATKNAPTRQGSKATATPRVDYVAKRMLSARRLKINELRNENEDMIQQIGDLKVENKYLRRTQHRQEKALERFEDQDSELPRLIQQHGEEVRSLKEQIRKYRDKLQKSERRKKDIEEDFTKSQKELQKLKTIASDKKLAEREELSRKLGKAELALEEKEQKCQELTRHVENLQKNHRRELATQISKQRELQKENASLHEELEKTQGQVKEKEKELEIKNIYSNRVLKPPHKLPSSSRSSPTPSPTNKPKKPKKSSPEVSPREKARLLEEKRREEERQKREEKQRLKDEKERKAIEPPSMDWDSIYDKEQQTRREREDAERREREERERMEREERERREREDRLRREDERKRREWEDADHQLKLEGMRRREEEERQRRVEEEERERERLERERREREERDRREREDRDRREREDREERDRREREDRERRAREEAERIASDAKLQEERRKKDLLLQRMKQIDESKSKGDPIDISPLTKKPVREMGDFSPSAERKAYTFTKPVENLHNGIPSHEEDEKKKKKNFVFEDDEDDDLGGYNPSFITQSKPSPSKNRRNARGNRSNLMESLFGDESSKPKSSFGEDDIFSSSTKAKPVSDRKSLPWASDSNTNNNDSPIFGEKTTSNKLLPRRARQDVSTFHAKPTVNAVDDIDDDIEEVVL